jgi:transcriptional regulator with XRE-family HTH domain
VSGRREPAPVTVAFGRRVRELRQERGWSLRHAGDLVALNWGTVSKIETGAGTSLENADRISAAFGMPLAVLLSPDSCGHCHGAPWPGFACLECGATGPGVTR